MTVECPICWASHKCCLPAGHDGEHVCQCSIRQDGTLIPHGENGNVGRAPYFGAATKFYS